MLAGNPLFVLQKHTATKAASITGACTIYAIMVHADGAQADLDLCDATTDDGGDEISVSAVDGDTVLLDFTSLGGIKFGTGLSITIAGSGAEVYIWTDKTQATA